MGSNNLTSVSDGQVIQSAHVEQYKTALTTDFLPRNISGVPTTNSGSVGSYTYKWNNVYSDIYNIGTAAANNYIRNTNDFAGANIDFYVGGTKRVTIDEAGIDATYLTNLSVTEGKLANLSVTNDKLGSLAVTAGKIALSTITNEKMSVRTLTREKMCDVAYSDYTSSGTRTLVGTPTLGSSADMYVDVKANDTTLTDSNTIIKPIMIMFTANTYTSASYFTVSGSASTDGLIYISRDMPGGSETLVWQMALKFASQLPSSSFMFIDTSFTAGQYLSTGNIRYTAYFRVQTSGDTITWNNVRMVGFPIK